MHGGWEKAAPGQLCLGLAACIPQAPTASRAWKEQSRGHRGVNVARPAQVPGLTLLVHPERGTWGTVPAMVSGDGGCERTAQKGCSHHRPRGGGRGHHLVPSETQTAGGLREHKDGGPLGRKALVLSLPVPGRGRAPTCAQGRVIRQSRSEGKGEAGRETREGGKSVRGQHAPGMSCGQRRARLPGDGPVRPAASAWVSAEPAQGLTETESSRALDTGGRERRSPSPLALAFPEGSCRWAHPPEHDITSHRKECSAP